MAVDPHWNSVVLRQTFDADFADVSNSAHPAVPVGLATITPDTFKFGGGAANLGNFGRKVRVPNSPDFLFGTGDFTVEFWLYFALGSLYTSDIIAVYDRSTNQRSWVLAASSSRVLAAYASSDGVNPNVVNRPSLGTMPLTTWTHLCLERSGNTLRVYRDGVMLSKDTSSLSLFNSTSDLYINGTASELSNTHRIVVDDVRITKGVARYASDAGFAVPTEAYPVSGALAPVVASGPVPGASWAPPTGTGSGPVVVGGPLPGMAWTAPGGTGDGTYKEARLTQAALAALGVQLTDTNLSQFTSAVAARILVNARVSQMALMVLAKGKEPPLAPNPLIKSDGGQARIVDLRMVNMYVEKTPDGPSQDARFGRPGLSKVTELGPGPVRATFLHKGFRYTVSGPTVWRDAVYIGEVPSDGNVRWAISDEEVVVVAGRRAYYVTLHDVSRINDPDLSYVRDVKFLAGRFIYFDDDTSGFYRYSELNDARKIDGLAFASAELNPDPIVGAEVQGELLAIFGTLTTEWHYPTTDPSNPFKRSAGRTYDKGCLAIQTVQRADNSLFFVGHDRMVYRASSGPVRVSDHEIENLLRKQTVDQFAANSAFKLTYGGHVFYVLNIVGYGTWAYDIGYASWAEWRSWGMDRFRVSVSDEDGFLGDGITGAIFGVDGKRYRDMDDPIERVISTFMPLASGTLKNFNLALYTVQGVGLMPNGYGEDPVVEMRFSDHLGLDFTAWMEAPLGKHQVRGREALAMWTSLGAFNHPGRVFEFRCTDPVEFSPYSAAFNEARL